MNKELKFYDLKSKKEFTTSKYVVQNKSGRNFAIATAPSGAKAFRAVSKTK